MNFLSKVLRGPDPRKQKIQQLENELQEKSVPESNPVYIGLLTLGVFGWLTTSAAIGFALWCVGVVFPVLELNHAILGILSVLGGGFLFFNVLKAILLSDSEVEYADKRRELAELKYDQLKSEKIGRVAYRQKGEP